ncbi:MAG: WD40/YVTN/BNR-like repeat-containing protein [Saprospiraceae bacterium]
MKHLLSFLPLFAFLAIGASAQTKLTSSTFGAIEARSIGPAVMGGRITAIDGVNSSPKTIYVGTAGGGVWKSTTAGMTFEPVFEKHPQSIGCLVIDQNKPETVWVGTGESNMRNSVAIGLGLYKTTDAGRNWTRVGLENSEHISKIILHPTDPNTLYVAVPGKLWSDSPDRGLYKTTDGGKTWEKILYTDEKTGCADILMDPRNPDVLLASMWQFRRTPYSFSSGGPGSALFKSTDGGKNWRKITNGLPTGEFGRIALALAPSAPDNVLAIVESEKTSLLISADGGESWKYQSANTNVTARPFYFSTLVVDPKDPKRVYRPAFSFSISTDGGYSFSEASNAGGWVHSDHHALWINPNSTNHMYLGTDGGVYMSLDQGVTWTHLNTLPVSQFYHVQIDDRSPYNVYGGLQDNGSWRGPSQSRGGIENRDWDNVGGGDGFWVQPDATDPEIIFSESQGGEVAKQNMRTNQSQFLQPQPSKGDEKFRWNWNTPLVKGAANPKTLYIGAQFLFKTTDRGNSWQRISPDLTTNNKEKQKQAESGGVTVDNTSAENHCTIFSIGNSPLEENLIFVGTDDGNIQVTRDGGTNWELISKNIPGVPLGTWVSRVTPSRFDRNVVYATFDNHAYGDMKTYAAKSADGGKTWASISTDKVLQGYAHVIVEDLENRDLLFLGTEFGLYISTDGGQSWVLYKSRLPEYVAVRDIVIHPKTNDLVLGTHGRGIFIIDDISPLRRLTAEVLQKDVALLPTRPTAVSSGHYGSAFPSTDSYAGPNTPELATIQYYLKDRLSTGDVTVEILDASGKVLASMPGTKRKGINFVRWDMRTAPPKAAKGVLVQGEFGVYAGFIGRLVLPGTYKVRVNAGGFTDEGSFTLVPDPLQPELDYTRKRDISNGLFDMVEELGLLVAQVQNLKDSTDQRIALAKDKKLNADLTQLSAQLEAFRKTLTETIESKGITGEQQLRARVGKLYVYTEFSDNMPTQSVLDGQKAMREELQQAHAKADVFFKKDLAAVNASLAKAKLRPLTVIDQKEWDKQNGQSAPPIIKPSWREMLEKKRSGKKD